MKNGRYSIAVFLLSLSLLGCATKGASPAEPLVTRAVAAPQAVPLKPSAPSQVSAAKPGDGFSKIKFREKVLTFWHKMPSTQWFINDINQEELG